MEENYVNITYIFNTVALVRCSTDSFEGKQTLNLLQEAYMICLKRRLNIFKKLTTNVAPCLNEATFPNTFN